MVFDRLVAENSAIQIITCFQKKVLDTLGWIGILKVLVCALKILRARTKNHKLVSFDL
jgi:hypothetical protein